MPGRASICSPTRLPRQVQCFEACKHESALILLFEIKFVSLRF
jgi:hypothetical protein